MRISVTEFTEMIPKMQKKSKKEVKEVMGIGRVVFFWAKGRENVAL